MSNDSIAAFCRALDDLDLLEPVQRAETEHLAAWNVDVRAFAKDLVRRDLITAWQAQMILNGRPERLLLGSYVLLEQLGEGGMGRVYRARHRLMGRIVALKVIRRRRSSDPEAIRRFQREIRAAATLAHPNVVMAFDADQLEDKYFFAMEYVEGIDLGRLIKDKGPLPVREACEYVRQTALGLQHAHERGLVHRDIKPSNLLLSLAKSESLRAGLGAASASPALAKSLSSAGFQGLIKILDLGLARLQDPPSGEAQSRLTDEGLIVGTPDFMAPEQARNSSKVDIRTDLYSLGCTFFYLLTGKTLFPEGTPTEKLLKQAMDPPPAVTSLRPEMPPDVAVIVHKLLEKRPEDRFPTPAELAVALEPYGLDEAAPTRPASHAQLAMAPAAPTAAEGSTASELLVPSMTQQDQKRRTSKSARPTDWGLWVPLALGALLVIAVLVYLIGSHMR